LSLILPVVPKSVVEAAEFCECEVGNLAAAVGGALERGVVDRDEASIPGEMEVGLDEENP
jgi:hypothetical protein